MILIVLKTTNDTYDSLQNNWGMFCTATEDDVDVIMSGYAFRLKILHEKGLSLLKSKDIVI